MGENTANLYLNTLDTGLTQLQVNTQVVIYFVSQVYSQNPLFMYHYFYLLHPFI